MSKKGILKDIYNIQELFPNELLNKLYLGKINEGNIDEYFSRSLITFNPVYLPIFEREGNIYCIHSEPGKTWESCSWVKLSHDFEYPALIASCFKYLPYALLSSPTNTNQLVDEIWEYIKSILSEGLEMPEKEYVRKEVGNFGIIVGTYDLENIPGKLFFKTSELFEDEAQEAIENIYKENIDDIYAIAALFLNRKYLKQKVDFEMVSGILKSEFNYPFYPMFWNTTNSALEVLEAIREAVIDQIPADNPLSLLKDCSYTDPELVDNFKKVADAFNEKGEPLLALNQLRNAASIMGAYGSGITKEWCKLLGEQADRVEKDCLSAKLAYYATEVIDLEP